jgi:SulP family sulfate permease
MLPPFHKKDRMFVPKSIVCLKNYSWRQFQSDFTAGVVVALVALPLAMAFSIACGLPPERGLYTAIVAGFLISALSGSRVTIGGPTGAFIVVVAGIVAKYGYEGLAAATAMAGLILILMGLTRMGSLVKYIPYPVITGFTTGIAVVILSTQIKDFLGLRMSAIPVGFADKWEAYFQALPSLNYYALAIGLFTILVIFPWPRGWKIPGSLIALTVASLAVSWGGWPVETIGSRFGNLPQGLPHPQFVFQSWGQVRLLIPSAFTIAALAAIESLLCAVVADGMIGGHHKSNLELVAQGIANCVSPLFGGIPATGAIARTATNVKNGGRTPMAGMVHALVLLGILLSAGPLAAHIPLAALAGILVVVCYHMSEWRSFKFILCAPAADIAVLLTTFLLTVFVSLTMAVGVGVALAVVLFARNKAALSKTKVSAPERQPEREENIPIPSDVEVYSMTGSFFFGAAEKLMQVEQSLFKAPRVLVLDMTDVFYMDSAGLKAIRDIRERCQSRGTRLILAGVQPQPFSVLQKAKKVDKIGKDNFKPTLGKALEELASFTKG